MTFRPPLWGITLAVLGCAAGIALGNWQQERASQKHALAAAQKMQCVSLSDTRYS